MYYQIEKLDGYYRIGSSENVFCYLIEGTERAALIDTGYGFGDLRAAVKSITEKPLLIFNTHGHCDHVGGNAQFEERTYIHEKDLKLCRQHTSAEMRLDSAKRAEHTMNYETGEEYNALSEGFDEKSYIEKGTGNLQFVSEGDVFDLGGVTLEIVETPGHTKGGISVLYKEKKLLFVGDAVGFFVWLFSEETTSRAVYISMLEKVYELDVKGFLGGHNPVTMTKEDITNYIRAAKEADYEKGQPFRCFLERDYNPRVCALDGMTLENMFEPGFAAIVISPDK